MPELFFDVETTGLPPRKANPETFQLYDSCRVVSIAWVLRDEKTVYSQRYSVTDPGISDEKIGAEFVHGISRAVMDKYGNNIKVVLSDFVDDMKKSEKIVAHNLEFDKGVISAELFRMGLADDARQLMNFNNLCTMKSTTNLVRIKNSYGSFKWPKLEELYKFLFGHVFENAHHAMCDVDALVACYYKLVEKYSSNKKKKEF
jgi:DNA polymerase III epsilon subunit-like protein